MHEVSGADTTWSMIKTEIDASIPSLRCSFCDEEGHFKDKTGKTQQYRNDITALITHLGVFPPPPIPGGSSMIYGPEFDQYAFKTNLSLSKLNELEDFFTTKKEIKERFSAYCRRLWEDCF